MILAQCVIAMQAASVTMLQRRFKIGYTSAVKIIDRRREWGHWSL